VAPAKQWVAPQEVQPTYLRTMRAGDVREDALSGRSLAMARLKAVWKADARLFRLQLATMMLAAVAAGVGAGILMAIFRSAVVPQIYPDIDGVNTRPPTIAAGLFRDDGASRFGAVAGRVVAYAPGDDDPASPAVARRVAEAAAAAAGLGADRVMGFEDVHALNAYHLDHTWDANRVTPPEGAGPGVGLSLVMNATLSWAVGAPAFFLPWAYTDSFSWQTSDCPVASLNDLVPDGDVPSSVCSGLLSWMMLVARAVAADLGNEAAQGDVVPSLAVRAIDRDSWLAVVDDEEAELEMDSLLGFLYAIGPLGVTGSLLGYITTQLIHMRRGNRTKQDANTAPQAYAMMRLAGMQPWHWWLCKMALLLPVALTFALSATLFSLAVGAFDQVGFLSPNDGGGAGAFFAVVFVATYANMPLYGIFAAIPLFNNPHNAFLSAVRSIVTSLAAIGGVAIFMLVVLPEKLEWLDIISGLLVPVSMARGIGLAMSSGPLVTDPTVSLGGVIVLMLAGGVINFCVTILVDNASDGSGW